LLTIEHHTEPVSSATWAPDGLTFATGGMDRQLCVWNLHGTRLYTWTGSRIYDCAISPDGRRLVAVCTENRLHVYNFLTREREYELPLPTGLTCVSITKDSRFVLISCANNEVQLRDIDTMEIERKYKGQKQGHFIIRSGFGGASENFVVSGSEGKNWKPRIQTCRSLC
jgi:WD repeat-containing protein 26